MSERDYMIKSMPIHPDDKQKFVPAILTGLELSVLIFTWIKLAMEAGISAAPIIKFGMETLRKMLSEGRSDPNAEEVKMLVDKIEEVRQRLHSD